ncbi:MAG: hypothetical protein WCT26_03470 [Candidatus Buchananbacteria bacterium]
MGGDGRTALAASEQAGKWKIMALLAFSRSGSPAKQILDGFKNIQGNNRFKIAFKFLASVRNNSQIRFVV